MKKKILAVDDEQAILRLIESKFINSGYDIICVSDGASAIDLIKSEKPDLVILDNKMPGIEGGAVLALIRSMVFKDRDISPNLPVIIYTAMDDKKEEEWFKKAKVIKYLHKEEGLDALVKCVSDYFSSSCLQ